MRLLSLLAALLGCLATTAAQGAILMMHEVAIDFADQKDASEKATWTKEERLDITSDGLGWEGEPAGSFDAAVTTRPIALGYNWRPPQQAGATITIDLDRSAYTLNSGQESRPYQGQVYLRYSPDLKHWSTWHVAKLQANDDKDEVVFAVSVGVPRSERKPYTDLLQKYAARRDVPASWDEERAVRWIVDGQPDYFAKHLPLVGYLQVMYEGNFGGSRRLRSIRVSIGYAMSGRVQAAAYRDAEGPGFGRHWKYAAEGVDRSRVIDPDP